MLWPMATGMGAPSHPACLTAPSGDEGGGGGRHSPRPVPTSGSITCHLTHSGFKIGCETPLAGRLAPGGSPAVWVEDARVERVASRDVGPRRVLLDRLLQPDHQVPALCVMAMRMMAVASHTQSMEDRGGGGREDEWGWWERGPAGRQFPCPASGTAHCTAPTPLACPRLPSGSCGPPSTTTTSMRGSCKAPCPPVWHPPHTGRLHKRGSTGTAAASSPYTHMWPRPARET